MKKLKYLKHIDLERARQAAQVIDKLRKAKVFDKGESSEKLIRRWREERK